MSVEKVATLALAPMQSQDPSTRRRASKRRYRVCTRGARRRRIVCRGTVGVQSGHNVVVAACVVPLAAESPCSSTPSANLFVEVVVIICRPRCLAIFVVLFCPRIGRRLLSPWLGEVGHLAKASDGGRAGGACRRAGRAHPPTDPPTHTEDGRRQRRRRCLRQAVCQAFCHSFAKDLPRLCQCLLPSRVVPSLCRAFAKPLPSLCQAFAKPLPSVCR